MGNSKYGKGIRKRKSKKENEWHRNRKIETWSSNWKRKRRKGKNGWHWEKKNLRIRNLDKQNDLIFLIRATK